MTLERIGDILDKMQGNARTARDRSERYARERLARNTPDAFAQTIFKLTHPEPAPKKKTSKRISAPRLIEVDSFGQLKIDIGFIAREFASIGLPHSDPGDQRVYYRTNGQLKFRVSADPDSFLPYGMYPRLLGAWVTTEACRTQSRTIYLGKNLSRFLEDTLHLKITGGKNGTITHLKEQMWRFFNCSIAIIEDAEIDGSVGKGISKMELASEMEVWWHPKARSQDALFESRIELGEKFFESIIKHPVPIDWTTVNKLRRSPLALDLYFWTTYRMNTLSGSRATISLWGRGSLAEQVGANYDLSTALARRDFHRKIVTALEKVHSYYPAAKIEVGESTITLIKSPTHVPGAKVKRIK